MKANMNPQQSAYGTNTFFSSWRNQKCRPTFKNDQAKAYNGANDVANSAGGRARGAVTPSECFYCVEPCRNSYVINGGSASVADQLTALVDSFCIGKSEESEGYKNSLAFPDFDIFDEDSHQDASATAFVVGDKIDSPYLTSTLRLSKSDPNGQTIQQDLEISNIQIEQIQRIKQKSDNDELPVGMTSLLTGNLEQNPAE